MNLSQLKSKVQALDRLAKNPGTVAEGQAAERAIDRLKKHLEEAPPDLHHGVDYEAIIRGPVFTSQKACPWKDRLFYALNMHYSCIPFTTWEDIPKKTRTDRLYKYYVYGNYSNVSQVMGLFQSLTEQISQEVRNSRPAIHRLQYESFRRGITEKLFDTLVPKHLRKTYGTTTEAVKNISKFAVEKNVHYSFVLIHPERYALNSPEANSLGQGQASKLSFDALLPKPKT